MGSETDCVFCRIAAGVGEPHERIAESHLALAFMNADPAARGHALVIPKAHAENIWELSAEDGIAVFDLVRRVAHASRLAFTPDGLNLFQANGRAGWQSVFHFHIHVVPRWHGDGLVPNWTDPSGDREDIAEAASLLRSALG